MKKVEVQSVVLEPYPCIIFKVELHGLEDTRGKFGVGFGLTKTNRCVIFVNDPTNIIWIAKDKPDSIELVNAMLHHRYYKSIVEYEPVTEQELSGYVTGMIPPQIEYKHLSPEDLKAFAMMKEVLGQ